MKLARKSVTNDQDLRRYLTSMLFVLHEMMKNTYKGSSFSLVILLVGMVFLSFSLLPACSQKVASKDRQVLSLEPVVSSPSRLGRRLDAAERRGVERFAAESCTGDIERTEKLVQLIENTEAFRQALDESGVYLEQSKISSVDFGKFVVVAVHAGLQSHCGLEVLLFGPIIDSKGNHIIEYGVTETEETCKTGAVAEAISYPFAFAKFPRLPKGLSYEFKEKSITSCFP